MPTVTFYRLSDGALLGRRFTGPESRIAANTPPGCGFVLGAFDDKARRVVNGVPELWKPPPPTVRQREFTWDDKANKWVRMDSLAFLRSKAKQFVKAKMNAAESSQSRAVRECLIALDDKKADAQSMAILRKTERDLQELRDVLANVPSSSREQLLALMGKQR